MRTSVQDRSAKTSFVSLSKPSLGGVQAKNTHRSDYRARYYDQSAGRFLNEDPTRFAGGANFYQYVLNDPTLWVDWSGTCPINLNKFVNWLDKHAHPKPTGECAQNIRLGLQQGGAKIPPGSSPVPAKDWGPFLTNNLGFAQLPDDSASNPQLGDITVFQSANGSPSAGHIEAWDGTQWVSDYQQGPPLPNGTHFYPNFSKYGRQPYKVYRCN